LFEATLEWTKREEYMNTPTVPHYNYFLAGKWQRGEDQYELYNPYTHNLIATVGRAGQAELEQALAAATTAFATTRAMPTHQRASILNGIAKMLYESTEEMALTIAQEAAKPIKQARSEIQRAIFTFAKAAEESSHINGEVLTLDATAVGEGRHGIVRRFPIGPVAAITPFNFPLNLVAHKLAPAIATGCPIILKPATQTPVSALKLAGIIAEAGLPEGALSVLPMHNRDATPLVEDNRIKLLTFTGSPAVGWDMKRRAGQKRVTLELGGNAGVIVHEDADLSFAAPRIAAGGFAYAGQSCISVQRVFVHHQIYKKFMSLFVPAVQALKCGDPLSEETDLSVVISLADGERIAGLLAEAKAAGAEVVTGGTVEGSMVYPTVLTNVDPALSISCQEVFAPVVTVQSYEQFDEALDAVNNSEYGLQAGVFTNNIRFAWQAYETLDVGGIIINDVPTWRVDHMPYGGVKQSGFGREGIRYAMEEMTEQRLLVFNMQPNG
jgi:glyceraldehyde-3-phosphate dehydrogenase (NADP+)